jgi:protein SCO1/2
VKRRGAAGVAAAVALLVACASPAPPATERRADAARLMSELMSGRHRIGGPFALLDPDGRRVALSDFRGKLVLLYFGFATCPDVCPTDLAAIAQALRELGAAADGVQPVFITLDPQRDAPQMLREYVAAFDPRFVALSGTEAEIRRVATDFKVFYEKVELPGTSTYTIDHTAYTFLLDREGRFVTLFPPGTPPERMVFMLREQLREHARVGALDLGLGMRLADALADLLDAVARHIGDDEKLAARDRLLEGLVARVTDVEPDHAAEIGADPDAGERGGEQDAAAGDHEVRLEREPDQAAQQPRRAADRDRALERRYDVALLPVRGLGQILERRAALGDDVDVFPLDVREQQLVDHFLADLSVGDQEIESAFHCRNLADWKPLARCGGAPLPRRSTSSSHRRVVSRRKKSAGSASVTYQ